METMTDFEKRIQAMRLEVAGQNKAVDELATSINYNKQQIVQHDQIACLQTLRARILKEVEDTKRLESAAQIGSTQGSMICGLATFATAGLVAAMHNRKDPLLIGIKEANSVWSNKIPFGSVFVAIGQEGLPENVEVAPISRLARESNKTEMEVKASWKHDGYVLVSPEQFAMLLNKVEQAVLDGSVCLPLARREVMKQLTR